MLNRRGLSLVELLVAASLAAVVFGAATTSLLRQQRSHARILAVTDGDAQSRAALLVAGAQLAMLDPRAGDLAAGEAEDSAIQFRALVASSFACATETGAATLLPDQGDTVPLGGSASAPRPGDTLWWLPDSSWRAAPVSSASTVTTSCVAPVASSGAAQRLALGSTDTIPAGTPLRVTRPARFGVYRASDGTWQLGYREWNDPTHRFAAPQPVVGPLVPRTGRRPSGFRYFDSAGVELRASGAPIDVRLVARIRLTASTLVHTADQVQDSVRSDSVDVTLRRAPPP